MTYHQLIQDRVATTIPIADIERWVELSEALASDRLPVMGFACHVLPRISASARGRLASKHVGMLSCAIATTFALPSDPRAADELRLAVAQLPDPALCAYEDLLLEVRPIVVDVCIAERLGRSGSLVLPWTVEYPMVHGTFLPMVRIPMRQPRPPAS